MMRCYCDEVNRRVCDLDSCSQKLYPIIQLAMSKSLILL
nr:MAG TPA: hypothetical protein [Caudoviricetes sp.]